MADRAWQSASAIIVPVIEGCDLGLSLGYACLKVGLCNAQQAAQVCGYLIGKPFRCYEPRFFDCCIMEAFGIGVTSLNEGGSGILSCPAHWQGGVLLLRGP